MKDDSGNILSGASVSSINQPDGMAPLYGLTNSTGYVTFSNIQLGTYTFKVEKPGYQELAETLDFNGGSLSLTLTLSNEKITIQAVSYDSANRVLTIYAQSQSSVSPVLNSIIVKDASGNTVATLGIGTITPNTTGNALSKGILYTIQANVNPNGLSTGTFTATLTTIAGSSFVSPTFAVSSQMPYYN